MILHGSGLSRPKRTIYRGIDADAGTRGKFADELGEDAKVGTITTGGNVLRLCQVESEEATGQVESLRGDVRRMTVLLKSA
jgi:hypothetical protein